MGLMDPKDVLAISDRIGKRYYFTLVAAISGAPNSVSAQGTNFYEMAHVCPNGDPEIEIATLSQARASDNGWNETTNPFTLASSLMAGASSSYSIIGAITNHFNTATLSGQKALTGSWNQFLETANPTGTTYSTIPTFPGTGKGVRVSEYFRRVYSSAGGQNLRARNVFYDAPDAFTFKTITGADNNLVTLEDLGDFGNGTSNDIADGNKFAATRMKLVAGVGGWSNSTTLEIQLVTEPTGAVVTENVSVSAMVAGAEMYIGDTAQSRFTKVNGVTVFDGTTTVGETLDIKNVFERVVQL